eukprot:4233187-Prymnesium_polylepis.1
MTSRVVSRSAAGPRELMRRGPGDTSHAEITREIDRRGQSTRRSSGVLVDSPRLMLHRCIAGTPAHLLWVFTLRD